MAFTLKQVEAWWDEAVEHGYEDFNKATVSYFRRFTDSAQYVRLPNDPFILDCGCGVGNGILFYSKQFGARGFGVDLSRKMLAVANARIKQYGLPFKTFPADCERLPFSAGLFDCVLSYETLEHTPDPAAYIREAHRVLKPDGIFVLTTPNTLWDPIHSLAAFLHIHHSEGPHRFVPLKEITSHVLSAGFRIEHRMTTVLVPIGPKFLTKLGSRMEHAFGHRVMDCIGLRRIYICRKGA